MRLFLSLLDRYNIIPLSSRPSSVDVVVKSSMQMMDAASQSASMIVAPLAGVKWCEYFADREFWAIEWGALNLNMLAFPIPLQVVDRWSRKCSIMQNVYTSFSKFTGFPSSA
jgi:hypothetical protein